MAHNIFAVPVSPKENNMITQRTIRNVGIAITAQKIYSTSCFRVATFQQAFTYQYVTMKWPKCYTTALSPGVEMTNINQDIEIWWDTLIKTVPTVPTAPTVSHNKPDIVVWKKNENKCFIIDICM